MRAAALAFALVLTGCATSAPAPVSLMVSEGEAVHEIELAGLDGRGRRRIVLHCRKGCDASQLPPAPAEYPLGLMQADPDAVLVSTQKDGVWRVFVYAPSGRRLHVALDQPSWTAPVLDTLAGPAKIALTTLAPDCPGGRREDEWVRRGEQFVRDPGSSRCVSPPDYRTFG